MKIDTNQPVLFLDIDGVLNGHEWIVRKGQPCVRKINHVSVKALQAVIDEVNPQVVIISTWRKWINDGRMTPDGFASMLATHGLKCNVIGATEAGPVEERTQQVQKFIEEHGVGDFAVLDDRMVMEGKQVQPHPSYGFREVGIPKLLRLYSGAEA